MLAEMEPKTFDEWCEYFLLEPWGEEWRQTGTIAAAIANKIEQVLMAVGKERPDVVTPEDFIPYKSEEPEKLKPRKNSLVELDMGLRALVGIPWHSPPSGHSQSTSSPTRHG